MEQIKNALKTFEELIRAELVRIERIKESDKPVDFKSLDRIVVGILPGDGIGPLIMGQALRVLRALAADEISGGRIVLREIEGMTIENRVARMQSLPDEVFEQVRQCHVLLKGPMVTPRAGDPWPNLISANTLLRRGLDLFAAVRPIQIPEQGIDWTFFRENIEGEYIWGNKGLAITEDLAVDFRVATRPGSERIARAAFEFARANNKKNVTVITKANIVKLTDGNFIGAVRRVGEQYPDIAVEERLVDAACAKLMDPEFNRGLEVFVLPNLYGDIVTDVAAEYQGA
jgi:isocitrate dehydrogenase (NAD+)